MTDLCRAAIHWPHPTRTVPGKKILAGLCLLFCLPVSGEPLNFEELTLNQGLSQRTVFSMTQDANGFLWMGTRDGLNRFDGYGFEASGMESGLPSSFIWTVAHEGNDLWLGTQGAGLVHRSPQGVVTEPDGGPTVVVDIKPSRDGKRLWLGTLDKGLVNFNKSTQSFSVETATNSLAVWSVLEDRDGDLWLGTADSGLAYLPQGSNAWRHYLHDDNDPDSISSDNIWKVIEDSQRRLWVASFGAGLNLLDKSSGKFQHFQHDPANPASLSNNHVWTLMEDKRGRLWVGTNSGLNLYNSQTGEFEHFLQGHEIKSLYEDNSGTIWVGTYYNGAFRLDEKRSKFELINHANGRLNKLPVDMVNGIAETRDSLWVASDGGGLTRFVLDSNTIANNKVTHYTHDARNPLSLGDNHAMNITELASGELLIGTYSGGLERFNPATEAFTHYLPNPDIAGSISDNTVFDTLQDRQHRIWVATWRGGLNRFYPDHNRFEVWRAAPDNPDGLADDYIQTLFEDRQGRLWLGTASAGLQQFIPAENRFIRYAHNQGNSINNHHVYTIANANDGKLWVGTEAGGLNLFDPETGTSTLLMDRSGYLNSAVLGILEDFRGHLWVSTRKGLVRFDPQTLQAQRYDEGDGIQSSEFIAGSYLQGRNGILYFGGVGGFNRFDPGHLESNRTPPPVVITRLRVLNSQFPRSIDLVGHDKISLDYREQPLALSFAALNFTRSELNRYTYRLLGMDKNWLNESSRREVIYHHLPPGTYQLEVKASNNDGVWNETPARFTLTVEPPWWLSPLALLSYTLLCALLFALLWNWRRKAVSAERARDLALRSEYAKQEFLAKMSHEIRTPLSGMISMGALLQRTQLDERQHRYLASLLTAGNALLNIINDILDFSKIEANKMALVNKPFNLRKLLREQLELFEPEASRRQVQLSLNYAATVPQEFNGDQNRLRQVLSNLIGNAVKFTEHGRISIHVSGDHKAATPKCALHIEIRDSGIGIDSDKLPHVFEQFEQGDNISQNYGGTGLGLSIARQLTELMGGSLNLTSQLGIGTTAHLDLSLEAIAPPQPRAHALAANSFRSSAKVLMVEDNDINAVALLHLLEDMGCEVTLTVNGREGIDYLQQHAVDLVLMDRHMPVMDGLEATRLIRQQERWRSLPIVALTASISAKDKADCLAVGMDDYLLKPLLYDKACELLQQHCPQCQQPEGTDF